MPRPGSGEERDPAHLPRLVEQRAGVAAKPDAGVDESGQIMGGEIPEPGAHRTAFHRDIDEECLSGLGDPGPLANADHLDVFTIEDAAQQRRVWHPFRWRKYRSADPAHRVGNDIGSKSLSRRVAFDFDNVAGVQLESRLLETLSEDELASLRREAESELAEPGRWGTTFTLIQSWGRLEG